MRYQFRCNECQTPIWIEGQVGQTPKPPRKCSCGCVEFTRVFLAPNIVYRGSGFYHTDKVLYEPDEDDLYEEKLRNL